MFYYDSNHKNKNKKIDNCFILNIVLIMIMITMDKTILSEIVTIIKDGNIKINANKIARLFINKGSFNIDYLHIDNEVKTKKINKIVFNASELEPLPFSALVFSAENGDLEMVSFLIEKNLDIFSDKNTTFTDNIKTKAFAAIMDMKSNDRKNDAFNAACKNGYVKIVEYLLNTGISKDERGLMLAGGNGHLNIIKVLENHGYDIHNWNDYILKENVISGNCDIVKYMVSKGSDIRYDNDDALWKSVTHGYCDIVEFIINNNLIDKSEYVNIFLKSVEYGHLEIIELMTKNNQFESSFALSESIKYKHIKLVEFFLKNGDINFKHFNSYYFLQTAMNNSSKDIINLLLFHHGIEKLQDDIRNHSDEILSFVKKNNISDYPILIQAYRNEGIDIFDWIEKEKI